VPGLNRRQDLFGVFDVLAIHPLRREVILVQTTTAAHLAHRLAKVKSVPELSGLLAAGLKVQVHGWRKVGARWQAKVVEVTGRGENHVELSPGSSLSPHP
jgi:hypothetical protein